MTKKTRKAAHTHRQSKEVNKSILCIIDAQIRYVRLDGLCSSAWLCMSVALIKQKNKKKNNQRTVCTQKKKNNHHVRFGLLPRRFKLIKKRLNQKRTKRKTHRTEQNLVVVTVNMHVTLFLKAHLTLQNCLLLHLFSSSFFFRSLCCPLNSAYVLFCFSIFIAHVTNSRPRRKLPHQKNNWERKTMLKKKQNLREHFIIIFAIVI